MGKFIKRIPEKVLFSLAVIFGSIIVYAIFFGLFLGSIFSLINTHDSYFYNVYTMALSGYFYFGGASLAVWGFLNLITTSSTYVPIGFGPGLYYGTIFLAAFLRDYITTSDSNLYLLSFTIVSLICYIVWLKHFKSIPNE